VQRKISQPWLFVLLAVGAGVVVYVVSGESLTRAVLGGLLFAGLVSLWIEVRKHIWRS
jgi:hypothetical protein